MEEYNNINWRENLLQDNTNFFTEEDFSKSNIRQFVTGELNVPQIKRNLKFQNEHCKVIPNYPGKKYYSFQANAHKQQSQFNIIEQQRLINALKVLQSEKLNLNKFELSDRELYNNCKPNILIENGKYLKKAEENWIETSSKGIKMNNVLYKHAVAERMNKLQHVLTLGQFYVPMDLLPWSFDESDVQVEMLHVANILDIGVVSQYMPPLLEDPFTLDKKLLPTSMSNEFYSKQSISCDKNIDEFLQTGGADVAISLSALKKILLYIDTNQLWTLPVVIKNIPLPTGGLKKVIFFDKPLVKQTISKVDLNLRCHKLLVRANLCRLEGFRYPMQDKFLSTRTDEVPDETMLQWHNAAYKLWTLKQQDSENSMMLKHRSPKLFKILVRTKIDACSPSEFGLQAITVVPKLEYQLKFGANAMTTQEIMTQWTDLTFRPNSLLQRVRTQFVTSEVVKIEPANLAKVSMEATRLNLRPHSALVVLYKLLMGLEQHPAGSYLLRHELKHGSFVALLKSAADGSAGNAFDLHKEYATQTNIIDPFRKQWTPIDPMVLLPAFEYHGHLPGLFKPSAAKPKVQGGVPGKKKKKNKGKKNNKKTKTDVK